MKRRLQVALLALAVGLSPFTGPKVAQADMFKLWVGLRGDYFNGTSDLFATFENQFGGGLEVGMELFGVGLLVDSLMMGNQQYLFTINLGKEFVFGEDLSFGAGIFTGILFFIFPEEEPQGTDLSSLSDDEETVLLTATGFSDLDEAEAAFDEYSQEAQELSRMAFGWNLIRMRLSLDYALGPVIHIGLAGQIGYHLLLSGEDVAAGARNRAIDSFVQEYGLDPSVAATVREALDARAIDTENLDGFNWDTGLYLRLVFEP